MGHQGGSPVGYYFRSIMAACVPLFFFSSGVLYAQRTVTLRRAIHKAFSLVVPLVFWALCSAAFFRWMHGEEVNPKWVILDAVTMRLQYSNWLWFIPVMTGVYIFAPFVLAFRDYNRKLFSSFVLLLCVFAFGFDALHKLLSLADLVVGSEFGGKLYSAISRYSLVSASHPEALAFFAVGVWIEGRRDVEYRDSKLLALFLLAPVPLAAYGYAMHALTGHQYDVTWNGYSSLTTLVIVLALYFLIRRAVKMLRVDSPVVKLATFVGTNSFAVYILHWFMRPVISVALEVAGVGSVLNLVLAPLAVVVCAAIGELTRRTPARVLLG